MAQYVISPRQASTPVYQKTLARELAVGESVSVEDLEKNRINARPILNYKAKVLGGKPVANEYADWLDYVIEHYGPRTRCLSLGSGLGRVEDYLVRKGFTSKIESIELCAEVNSALRIDNDRVAVLAGDLNFVELPEAAYDFIVCHGVLHHLINLEFVLGQIRKALKPDGIFLVYEYVGETRWRFSEQRMAYLRAAFPTVRFSVPHRSSIEGFESVRSADLLSLIELYFGEHCDFSRSYGGVYFPFVTCTNGRFDGLLERVVEIDEIATGQKAVAPCYHMGIYRGGATRRAQVVPWTDQDLVRELSPPVPWHIGLSRLAKQTPVWQGLRQLKRRLIS